MILCSGCFDGIHAGHVAYLRAVAKLKHDRELMYVAVAPDAYVRHAKGREPRWNQDDRRAAVRAIAGVSATFIHHEQSIAQDVAVMRPRVLVKGAEWAGNLTQDVLDACKAVGCMIVYVEMAPVRHTSDV